MVISRKLVSPMHTFTHTHTHTHTHTGRYLKELKKQFQDKLAEANNVAEETVSNMRTVKSFSNEFKMAAMYGTEIDLSYKLGRNQAVLLGNVSSIGCLLLLTLLSVSYRWIYFRCGNDLICECCAPGKVDHSVRVQS